MSQIQKKLLDGLPKPCLIASGGCNRSKVVPPPVPRDVLHWMVVDKLQASVFFASLPSTHGSLTFTHLWRCQEAIRGCLTLLSPQPYNPCVLSPSLSKPGLADVLLHHAHHVKSNTICSLCRQFNKMQIISIDKGQAVINLCSQLLADCLHTLPRNDCAHERW